MGVIAIEGMEFFAYHGCLEEERIIGNHFQVDLFMEVNTEKAELTDDLHQTVNYQKVYAVTKKQMEIKSKLLEHLSRRIADAIIAEFPSVTELTVKVSKRNPPIGGKVEKVSVIVKKGH
jgi:7,8-dihydroneopterin aldolase/epimerase/oxygenase